MKKFWKRLFQNKGSLIGFIILSLFLLIALFAPLIAPYSPTQVIADAYTLPPVWAEGGSMAHIFGTDDIGRDLFSRLIYGTRVSLFVGLLVVTLSLFVGVSLGLLAGYFGGWVDSVVTRFVDILMSVPSILLAIVIAALLGPSLTNGILAVSIISLPGFIRVVRASVLSEKAKCYVDATVSFGAGHARIAVMNILPNCMAPIIVQATLGFSDGILNVAALGFLGLGAQAPTPEWGTMLADSRNYIESASWLVTLPGLCILIVVLSFNILGDGLRDALDPKLRGN